MLGNDGHNWSAIPERRTVAESVSRRGPLSKLDRGAPLTIVRAPHGYGKSSLIASWLRATLSSERIVVWVSAPQHDLPASEYWTSVRTRLNDCGIIETRNVQSPTEDPYSAVLRALRGTARPVLLVLIRPDHITNAALDDQLVELLHRCHGLDLVVTLTGVGMFPEPYLLDIDHEVVTSGELLFSVTDIGDLLTLSDALALPDEAEHLAALTGGLPALVRAAVAAIKSIPSSGDRAQRIEDKVTRAVDLYMADHVLDTAERLGQRLFLLVTAYARRLTTDIAALLFESEETGQQIRTRLGALETAGLITRVDEPADEQWELASAIRQSILRLHARAGIDPRHRLSFLAHHQLDRANYADALDYAVEAQNWTLAVDIIEQQWISMISRNLPTLRAALQQIPPEAAAKHTAVQAGRALFGITHPGDQGSLLSLPETPTELHELGASAQAKDALSIGCVHSIMLRLAGEYARSADVTRRLSHLSRSALEHHPDDIGPQLPLMRVQWAINYQLHGSLTESTIEARLAYHGGRSQSVTFITRNAAGSTAMNWALVGEPLHALHWSELERRYPDPDGWLEPLVRIAGLVARTLASLDTLDTEQADAVLTELGPPTESEELWAFVVYAHCQAALAACDPFPALTLLHRTITAHTQHHTPTSFAQPLLLSAEIDLLLALGEANKAWNLTQTIEDPTANPWTSVSSARLHQRLGHNDAALALCHQFDWTAESYPRAHMESLLIRAVAHTELGHQMLAAQAWTHACSIADQTGLLRPFTTISSTAIGKLETLAHTRSPSIAEFLKNPAPEAFPTSLPIITLTEREHTVLTHLAQGRRPSDIAHDLYVSVNTVKTQLRTLYKKLDAHNRAEALARAYSLGLISHETYPPQSPKVRELTLNQVLPTSSRREHEIRADRHSLNKNM